MAGLRAWSTKGSPRRSACRPRDEVMMTRSTGLLRGIWTQTSVAVSPLASTFGVRAMRSRLAARVSSERDDRFAERAALANVG
jgi:hypothetical protein